MYTTAPDGASDDTSVSGFVYLNGSDYDDNTGKPSNYNTADNLIAWGIVQNGDEATGNAVAVCHIGGTMTAPWQSTEPVFAGDRVYVRKGTNAEYETVAKRMSSDELRMNLRPVLMYPMRKTDFMITHFNLRKATNDEGSSSSTPVNIVLKTLRKAYFDIGLQFLEAFRSNPQLGMHPNGRDQQEKEFWKKIVATKGTADAYKGLHPTKRDVPFDEASVENTRYNAFEGVLASYQTLFKMLKNTSLGVSLTDAVTGQDWDLSIGR